MTFFLLLSESWPQPGRESGEKCNTLVKTFPKQLSLGPTKCLGCHAEPGAWMEETWLLTALMFLHC